ncbi:Endonuclease/exonuclease/phosphatase, partial [Lenzites betulinus]
MRGQGGPTDCDPSEKWLRLNQLVRDAKISILALQETHLPQERADRLNNIFNDSIRIITSPDPAAPTAARGVAFVLNKRLINAEEATHEEIIAGRAMSVSVPWGANRRLNILNVYAPNATSENATFWTEIKEAHTHPNTTHPDIMMGDFNIVEHPRDRLPERQDNETATEALATLVRTLHMKDGWRESEMTKKCFTYLQSSTGSQSRLDRIYVKDAMLPKTADWDIVSAGIKTDHQMVTASVANYNTPYVGKGRWTMPTSIIEDADFLKYVTEEGIKVMSKLQETRERTQDVNPQRLYLTFKEAVRQRAKQRTKELYSKWDKKIKALRDGLTSTLN